jgi:hypothetical protein
MDKVIAYLDEHLHRHLGIVRGPAVPSQMAHCQSVHAVCTQNKNKKHNNMPMAPTLTQE